MIPYEKQLKALSQNLRKNMTDAENMLWIRLRRKQLKWSCLLFIKSPLAPLFQRGEEKDPHDYTKTLKKNAHNNRQR
jgi:hypothetical protein